ncbi:hypothetical protein QJS04_geneDACA012786 [Acorus gramineus]|uniref:Uncharacterized protein n=1 Tax=Acorus gramineus TaxID=55184 RepID=A0AAV9BJ75_ACOGR|nr:hypothetical protein QJS04_geneDACA012786 [Acorus gramineus]
MECRKSHKRRFISVDSDEDEEKVYKFQILLPDGTSTHMALHNPGQEMFLGEFACAVKKEVYKSERIGNGKRRKIMWDNDIFFEDLLNNNKFRKTIKFNCLREDKLNRLRLYDLCHSNAVDFYCLTLPLQDGGEKTIEKFQNMWDLTPDTDLLAELPAEYTFESALADLIVLNAYVLLDNSLQAVWSNGPSERRLISVSIDEHKLLIFDTGPGMDGSDENSIIKWGKMGSSNNRSSKGSAIGGKPPYLKPFFGMFGYGGSIASMHLGRYAMVSSKTRESQKVFILHLSREHLLEKSDSWRAAGGIRDPREKEIKEAPHGSFTEVEIQEPTLKVSNTFQLQCRLKDIYFPYIQCDELRTTLKTNTPVEFLIHQYVFLLLLKSAITVVAPSRIDVTSIVPIKICHYHYQDGKESIDKILEELKEKSCDIVENYEKFSRVSIRRLGRLLPDARWRRLPFMELRQRKGDRDTDAGFSPTPSKTDLAHHDPFTISLKNFGNKPSGRESDVDVEIRKGGKLLTPSHLEKEYQDWIFQMHEKYDEEIGCGEDEPVVVLNPRNKKGLCISADVVRVHHTIRRNGRSWKSGEKIKFLKGSPGCHKNVLYATLEYILLEGFQGDVGGEARLICRPLGCLEEEGCLLTVDDGNACLDIRKSLSFPISVIDHGKCHVIDLNTWNDQLDKQQRKAPSTIDILGEQQCQQLEIDGALPTDNSVSAGHAPPELVVGVIRPGTFDASSSSGSLDQKFIVKDDLEMTMEIRRTHDGKQCHADEVIHGERVKPSSYKGLQGLYIFSLGLKSAIGRATVSTGGTWPGLKAAYGASWRMMSMEAWWVGSSLSCLRIACYDVYSNRIPFSSTQATINIEVEGKTIAHVEQMEKRLSPDKLAFEFKDIMVKTSQLDMIRPNYRGTLTISSRDKRLSATVPCQEEGEEVSLKLEGFHLLDQIGSTRKVDRHGLVNLSGLLRVEAGYGAKAELSIYTAEKMVFKEEFQTAERELKVVSGISVLRAPKMELVSIPEPVETFYSPSSSNKDRLFQDSSPCVPDHMYNWFKIILNNNLKRLEDDLLQVGLQIQEHEDRLSMLNNHKESTRKEIFDLREKQIEEKVGTAAAVFANLSKSIQIQEPQKYFMQDVLGLVALLGTVDDDRVSRILGDYLGEDYMLAVVCMSSKTASALERYSEDGNIYYESPLHEAAAALGMTIKRRCPVIFLDDIRPYTGRLEDSNQSRWLALPHPCLPCGKPPPGFIGYAVNMINLDVHHLNTRTAAGHGLRETLYYRLFGDLQVYETRAHMKEADACIKQHGAVSLDGGIKRGNGIIFLGGCETGVRFPVFGPHTRTILSQCTLEVMKQIENKKSEMEAIEAELDKETEAHVRVMMKFRRKKQRLEESLEEMKPLCNGQLSEYNTSPKS